MGALRPRDQRAYADADHRRHARPARRQAFYTSDGTAAHVAAQRFTETLFALRQVPLATKLKTFVTLVGSVPFYTAETRSRPVEARVL
mgnify:CR=1 FL=1